jgi:hypothetical protein
VFFAGMLAARRASAIPTFAYVYNKPCSTCHTVYPQLNPEGERFAAKGMHGYRPVVEPIRLGTAFALPGTVPLSISGGVGEDLGGTARGEGESFRQHATLEFLGVMAGSELGPHLSFLADYAALVGNPTNGNTTQGNRPGLGFLQAHAEPFGWLGNAKVGLQELPLGASPRVHRLSTTPYLVYQVSPASLLGARPPVQGPRDDTLSLASTQYALELSVLDPTSELGVFLGGALGSNNKDDFNDSQDVFLRLQYGLFASKAGLFVYYSPDALGPGVDDHALRIGPDLTLYGRRGRVVAQFLAGWDSNPTGAEVDFWYYGGFLEVDYRITPDLMALARLDAVGSPGFDDTGRGGQVRYDPRLWDVTAGLQYLLDENLKVLVEATYGATVTVAGEGPGGSVQRSAPETWALTFQLRTAFFPLRPPFYRWFAERRRGVGA